MLENFLAEGQRNEGSESGGGNVTEEIKSRRKRYQRKYGETEKPAGEE
jgi:hypothetical protein